MFKQMKKTLVILLAVFFLLSVTAASVSACEGDHCKHKHHHHHGYNECNDNNCGEDTTDDSVADDTTGDTAADDTTEDTAADDTTGNTNIIIIQQAVVAGSTN